MNADSPGGPVERIVGRHTPGPWAAGESADGEYLVWAKSDPTTAIAAVLPGPCADANASVFAAAPKLLAALQMLDERGHTDAFAKRAIAEALGVPPNLNSTTPTVG